jgi:hypothetical protein
MPCPCLNFREHEQAPNYLPSSNNVTSPTSTVLYMLHVPRSIGASICLQCQYRIWRRALPASKSGLERSRPQISCHSSFSTTHSRYDSVEQEQKPEEHQSPRQRLNIRREPIGNRFKVIYPHGRIRGRRGKEVVEDAARLDVKSLGELSEIIVLKDADLDEPAKERIEEAHVSGASSGMHKKDHHISVSMEEILKSIKDGSQAASQDAVNNNLELLRSKTVFERGGSDSTLSSEEYITLRDRLVESYSTQQLLGYREYVDSQSGETEEPAKTIQQKKKNKRILRRIGTVEGESNDTIHSNERSRVHKRTAIADHILCKHWKLDPETTFHLELSVTALGPYLLAIPGMYKALASAYMYSDRLCSVSATSGGHLPPAWRFN